MLTAVVAIILTLITDFVFYKKESIQLFLKLKGIINKRGNIC